MMRVLIYFVCVLFGLTAGFVYPSFATMPQSDIYVSGELKIHFFEFNSKYSGDSFLIQVGTTEVLVDAGPKTSEIDTIYNYITQNTYDDIIEYAIVTHAHEDHMAGFGGPTNGDSLFDKLTFGTIIDFPNTNSTTQLYGRYIAERQAEIDAGAKHYTALECYNNENGAERIIKLSEGIELEILYNYYYDHDTNEENEYSVCFQINQGDKHFLFTGDLESHGEELLAKNNNLKPVELFKAGHHGSNTSNCEELMRVIQPKIVIIPCVAGTTEYTTQQSGIFPTQKTINTFAAYTEKIYAPTQAHLTDPNVKGEYTTSSLNGNILITSNKNETKVECTVSDTVLKDTDWFKTYRTWPTAA